MTARARRVAATSGKPRAARRTSRRRAIIGRCISSSCIGEVAVGARLGADRDRSGPPEPPIRSSRLYAEGGSQARLDDESLLIRNVNMITKNVKFKMADS